MVLQTHAYICRIVKTCKHSKLAVSQVSAAFRSNKAPVCKLETVKFLRLQDQKLMGILFADRCQATPLCKLLWSQSELSEDCTRE